ncbi:MAG: hypothetical protein JST30_07490 [Armatimonadetes bacterium]|nr:hypothetical protein [Armatimonadota bacterium]
MRRLVLFSTLLTAASIISGSASAETGRWQLGNPSLIIDLPGEPTGGGVSWHEGLGVLPTSWSSESADLRVEVSEQYGDPSPEKAAETLAGKLGGSVSGGKAGQVSGQPSSTFQIGKAWGLTIAAEGRVWSVLASPKTAAGATMASSVLGSVVLEQWGTPRWVRRCLGKTRLNAELPYELAAENGGRPGGFELHFSDFVVTASVSEADEGHTIDFDGTVKQAPALEKARTGTTDFTSKTEKVERDGFRAFVVTMTFHRGSKSYVLTELFTMDEGRLLRVNMTGRQGNAEHEAWAARVLDTLKVSSVDLASFAPRSLGNEGVWFDAPRPFSGPTASGSTRTYAVDFGAFGCDVRVVDTGGNDQDLDQLMDFAEARFKPKDDVKDYSSDVTRKFVDGVEARVLRVQYKRKGRGDFEVRSAIALGLPDRLVLLEVVANEAQAPYIDRVIGTARVEIPAPSGWKRRSFGSSGFSYMFGKDHETPESSDNFGAKTLSTILDGEGILAEIHEMTFEGAPPMAGILVNQVFQRVKSLLKVEGKIAEQRPYGFGARTGVYATLEFEHPQAGKVKIDLIVVRRGSVAHAVMILPTPGDALARVSRAALINSLR